jgi:TolB-like protein/Flp pilus assembly protein TadD
MRRSLFSELKRRNVIRMASLYLVGAWLVTQVAGTVLPMFEAPNWLPRSIVVLLAIGFVPTLIFSWIYELTPEGLKRDADVPPDQSIVRQTGRRIDRMIIVVLVLALIAFAFDRFVIVPQHQPAVAKDVRAAAAASTTARSDGNATPSPATNDKSIAVLPFESLSKDEDNAYFASGMQDMILTKLAGIGDLKVISRTSTAKYASHGENLSQIAQQLGVATILEGSVQKAGNQVLINLQLIDAATDRHLWAEAYPRTLDNIFGVEGEVAQKVAEALHATLTRDERSALALKPTQNADALEAYLKALAMEKNFATAAPTYKPARQALERAVELDPAFVLAWTELAVTQFREYWFGYDPTPERLAGGRSAMDHAVALAPDLPQVELTRAQYLYYTRDFAGALALMRRVQGGLPGDGQTWWFTAIVERRLGRWDVALSHFRQAQALDPGDMLFGYDVAMTLVMMRRWDAALALIDASIARDKFEGLYELKLLCEWNLHGIDSGDRLLAPLPQNSVIDALRSIQALYRRDYAAVTTLAERSIAADNGEQSELFAAAYLPSSIGTRLRQALASSRSASGSARAEFERVKVQADSALATKLVNANVEAAWHATLGFALAGLGDRVASVAEGKRATELIVESADGFEGPYWLDNLAQIYALNGDAANAIPLIEHLVKTSGSLTTPALLTLDPLWDAIRGDPKFQALARPAPAVGAPDATK